MKDPFYHIILKFFKSLKSQITIRNRYWTAFQNCARCRRLLKEPKHDLPYDRRVLRVSFISLPSAGRYLGNFFKRNPFQILETEASIAHTALSFHIALYHLIRIKCLMCHWQEKKDYSVIFSDPFRKIFRSGLYFLNCFKSFYLCLLLLPAQRPIVGNTIPQPQIFCQFLFPNPN